MHTHERPIDCIAEALVLVAIKSWLILYDDELTQLYDHYELNNWGSEVYAQKTIFLKYTRNIQIAQRKNE